MDVLGVPMIASTVTVDYEATVEQDTLARLKTFNFSEEECLDTLCALVNVGTYTELIARVDNVVKENQNYRIILRMVADEVVPIV